jgi:hypothetical protein
MEDEVRLAHAAMKLARERLQKLMVQGCDFLEAASAFAEVLSEYRRTVQSVLARETVRGCLPRLEKK